MRLPGEWADYPLIILGMRAVFCRDVIIVQQKSPGSESSRELEGYGEDVLVPGARMIMIRGGIHFLALYEVDRGWDGGSGDGDARE
ncbi:unnamed protein product, partial [Scytosiphon promiscuus]